MDMTILLTRNLCVMLFNVHILYGVNWRAAKIKMKQIRHGIESAFYLDYCIQIFLNDRNQHTSI